MTSKSDDEPVVASLNDVQYVLAPSNHVKIGDEYHEIFVIRSAIEAAPEETGLIPSNAQRLFAFNWDIPETGEVIVLPQIGDFLIPSGSTRVGYTKDGTPIVLDPIPNEHSEGPWLGAGFTSSDSYAPLSIPGLHRKFARACQTDTAVRRFAGRYGLLGHGAFALSLLDGEPVVNCRIESIQYWCREIAAMRRLVKIWDLIKHKEVGKLDQWVKWTTLTHPDEGWTRQRVIWDDEEIEWDEEGQLIINQAGEHTEIAMERQPARPIPEHWKTGDILEPAYLYLCRNINDRLSDHVNPFIMPFIHGDIMLWPDCLLSAMYVLFALEVSGKSRPAIMCRGCEIYFIPEHGSQRYCEPRCSQRAWWRKKHPPINEA